MKLKKYSDEIAALAAKYPNAEVVHASDDEGNSFRLVYYTGTMGYYTGGTNGEFYSEKYVKEAGKGECAEEYVGKKPNAVCIN